MSYPRPKPLASVNMLRSVWSRSRDGRARGRAPGIDDIRPEQFRDRLSDGLARVRERMLSPDFRFMSLRSNFIPKKTGGDRVICVPTVEDRLIQRVILEYLNEKDKLAVRNDVSYGFHLGSGVEKAIKKAKNLRREHPWALKCDIESFFNKINRESLKREIAKKLGKRSVVPLLFSAIDTEIKLESRTDKDRLAAAGIVSGRGLRQGMPLSPLLSNFVLRSFDKGIVQANLKMVRYADDFIVFCDSDDECHQALALTTTLLAQLNHTVPALGPGSKTVIAGPQEPIEFLGFDIAPEKGSYKITVPARAFERVHELLVPFGSYDSCRKDWSTLGAALQALNAKMASFASSYSIATNSDDLRSHIKNCKKAVITKFFRDLLGVDALSDLSDERLAFLDIDSDR